MDVIEFACLRISTRDDDLCDNSTAYSETRVNKVQVEDTIQRLGIRTNKGAKWFCEERRKDAEIGPLDTITHAERRNNRKEKEPNYHCLL